RDAGGIPRGSRGVQGADRGPRRRAGAGLPRADVLADRGYRALGNGDSRRAWLRLFLLGRAGLELPVRLSGRAAAAVPLAVRGARAALPARPDRADRDALPRRDVSPLPAALAAAAVRAPGRRDAGRRRRRVLDLLPPL